MFKTELLPDSVKAVMLPEFSACLENIIRQYGNKVHEIRIRRDRPVSLTIGEKNYFITKQLALTTQTDNLLSISTLDFDKILHQMCEQSVYAKVNDIANGYVTIGNGCRVGIAGKAVTEAGGIKTFSQINLLSIRMAREIIGCADEFVAGLLRDGISDIPTTLLISPPKYGKTTILRDTARQLSDKGLRVAVIDEKNEIAGMIQGVPSYHIGHLTDVLTDIKKSTGIIYAVRNLSPQVILCDEIGSSDEVDAVLYGMHAGVPMILSCHSRNYEEVKRRFPVNKLIDSGAVRFIAVMNASGGIGKLSEKIRM